MAPCHVCGQQTTSKYGVCKRSRECQQEYRYRSGKVPRPRLCRLCNRPLKADNRIGFCRRTPQCARARDRARRPGRLTRVPCDVCGKPTSSKYGVCRRSAECAREAAARYRRADLEAARRRDREWVRAYKQRPGRRCAYARSRGCTNEALIGQRVCQKCQTAYLVRRKRRVRQRLAGQLAELQNGLCPACGLPLPADLRGTHLDHIWPQAQKGPDSDWNLQVLHGPCNQRKGGRLAAVMAILTVAEVLADSSPLGIKQGVSA